MNKIIKLLHGCINPYCSDGEIPIDHPTDSGICEDCNNGIAEMIFRKSYDFIINKDDNHYYVLNLQINGIEIYDNNKMEFITESLDPISLTWYKDEECPTCNNRSPAICSGACHGTGKILAPTGRKHLFDSKGYDGAVYRKRMSGGHDVEEFYPEEDRRKEDRRVENTGNYE